MSSIRKVVLVRVESKNIPNTEAAIIRAKSIIRDGVTRHTSLYHQKNMSIEAFLDAVYPEDKDLDPSIKLLRYEALGDDALCDRIAQIGDEILDRLIPKEAYEEYRKYSPYCSYHLSLKKLDFSLEGSLPEARVRVFISYNLVRDGWVYGDAGKDLSLYAGEEVSIPDAIHYTKYNKAAAEMVYPALGKERYAMIDYLIDGEKLISCSKEHEDEVKAFFRAGEDVFIVPALVWYN